MKTSKRILYFVAFVTTAFYLTWRLVATIPWHDSWVCADLWDFIVGK